MKKCITYRKHLERLQDDDMTFDHNNLMKKTEEDDASASFKVYDFSLKNALLLCLAIPLLVITACHRTTTTVDSSVIFGKVVTAADVDSSNAPTALSDTFSTTQKTIYVVAEAKQVAPDTRLSASWTRDGVPVQVSNEVVADQGYHNSNIEFHLDAGENGFLPGNYKVQILVNSQPGPTASFTVK
jgi:hypothetical protein